MSEDSASTTLQGVSLFHKLPHSLFFWILAKNAGLVVDFRVHLLNRYCKLLFISKSGTRCVHVPLFNGSIDSAKIICHILNAFPKGQIKYFLLTNIYAVGSFSSSFCDSWFRFCTLQKSVFHTRFDFTSVVLKTANVDIFLVVSTDSRLFSCKMFSIEDWK